MGTPPWPQGSLTLWEELRTGEEDWRRTFQSIEAEGREAKGSIVHLLGEHQKVELG